jgi:hypothetical protein
MPHHGVLAGASLDVLTRFLLAATYGGKWIDGHFPQTPHTLFPISGDLCWTSFCVFMLNRL